MLVFDIGADGRLEECTKVHSLVMKCTKTREKISCADQPGYTSIATGLEILEKGVGIVAHNLMGYDDLVLEKLYNFKFNHKKRDTLLMSQLLCGHERREHSLASWGDTLGFPKYDYDGGWENGPLKCSTTARLIQN